MKETLLSLALIGLIACSGSNVQKNDVQRYGYKGQVKKIETYKYNNYTGTLDSANFNVRTVYDYSEDGHVSFMQLVLNRSMFPGQTSVGINFHYRIKGGTKTGWQEINLANQDTTYGTIEWLDATHIYERKYTSDNQVAYEIITELDPKNWLEKEAEIKKYVNDSLIDHQKIVNVTEGGDPIQRIYINLTKPSQDTVLTETHEKGAQLKSPVPTQLAQDTIFIENLKKDEQGNVIVLVETNGRTGAKTYIRKDFYYY